LVVMRLVITRPRVEETKEDGVDVRVDNCNMPMNKSTTAST